MDQSCAVGGCRSSPPKSSSKMDTLLVTLPASFIKQEKAANLWKGNANSLRKKEEFELYGSLYIIPEGKKPSFTKEMDMAKAIDFFKERGLTTVSCSDKSLDAVFILYTDLMNLKATGKLLEQAPELFLPYLNGKDGRSITSLPFLTGKDGRTIKSCTPDVYHVRRPGIEMTPILKGTRKDLLYILALYLEKNETLLFQKQYDVFILLLALTLDTFHVKKVLNKQVEDAFLFIALMQLVNLDKSKFYHYLNGDDVCTQDWFKPKSKPGFNPVLAPKLLPSPLPKDEPDDWELLVEEVVEEVVDVYKPEPEPEPEPTQDDCELPVVQDGDDFSKPVLTPSTTCDSHVHRSDEDDDAEDDEWDKDDFVPYALATL